MRMSRITRAIAWAFIVLAAFAAVLNSFAAVASARNGRWSSAGLYLVIAVTIGAVTFLGWYSIARQRPYRWRRDDREV
jgi:hypothetical protein